MGRNYDLPSKTRSVSSTALHGVGQRAIRAITGSISWLLVGLLAFASTTTIASADVVYVGDYGGSEIRRFDGTTGAALPSTPWLSGIQTEGLAGLSGVPGAFNSVIFAGNANGSSIELLNANAAVGANPVINASFITGLSGVANVALSLNGHTLYVAQEVSGLISEYNSITGAFIKSVAFAGAHDVYVGPDGSVYASAYGITQPASVGVWKFHADLSNGAQFIAPTNNNLTHATGMAIDNSGNFWVANAGTINNGTGTDFVSEYSSTGVFMHKISNNASNQLLNVFGLTKAADGNLYAAVFGSALGSTDGSITKINVSSRALSTFIPAGTAVGDAGLNPKYAWSSADTVIMNPEPSSLLLLGMGIASVGVPAWFRKRGRVSIAA